MSGWCHRRLADPMCGGPRRWTTGPSPDGLLPARADARSGEPGRPKADGTFVELRRQGCPGFLPSRPDAGCGEFLRPKADGSFAELRRQWSPGFLRSRADARSGGFYPLRVDATFAGSPQHHGPWSTLARGPETMSGSSGAVHRRQVSGGHAGCRRPLHRRGRRRRDRCAVPARRVRRPSDRGRSSWTRWSRPAADSSGSSPLRRSHGLSSGSSGSSPFRRSHGLSSGCRDRRRYDRRRLPLAP
jgi:hypothetical protein